MGNRGGESSGSHLYASGRRAHGSGDAGARSIGEKAPHKGSRNKSESVGLNKEARYTRERHFTSHGGTYYTITEPCTRCRMCAILRRLEH